MKQKLTATNIKSLEPANRKYEVWDTEVAGFHLRVTPAGGKTYYLFYRHHGQKRHFCIGKHGNITPVQARDLAKKLAGKVAHGIDIQTEKAEAKLQAESTKVSTLGAFIEKKYAPWVLEHRKTGQGTLDRLHSNFGFLMNRSLADVNQWVVEKWRSEQLKSGKAKNTINRDVVALRAVLSKAMDWDFLLEHPLSRLKPLKTDANGKIRYLEPDEEKRLLNALHERDGRIREERVAGNHWRRERGYEEHPSLDGAQFADNWEPMVLLSINTGLRRGELFDLRWTDINLKTKTLTVQGGTSKSGQTRHNPLNEIALDALKEWRNQSNGSEYVFPARNGGRMDNVRKSWATLLELAEISNFRWHDMRHDFASKLVMKGVALNTVRELMGHRDIATTLRYAHLAPDHKAEAVAQLVG